MMGLREIIAELEGAACWEAVGINALETTHFEPELDARAQESILAAKRRAQALNEAVRLLRHPLVKDFAGLPCDGARSYHDGRAEAET